MSPMRRIVTFNRVPKSSRLDLLEAREYPSGNVRLRYARANQP
jgi:hypothetical protein